MKAILLLTNSKEQTTPWEAKRSSASQEISLNLWNLELNSLIYCHPRPVSILSQINSNHAPFPIFRIILMFLLLLRLVLPSGLITVCPPIKIVNTLLLSHAICSGRLIFLNLITRIIHFEYRSQSFSLRSFLHSLVTSSLK